MSEMWGIWGEKASESVSEIPPFFTMIDAPDYGTNNDGKNPNTSKLDWLKNSYINCIKESALRTRIQQALLLAYKGYYDPFFLDRSDILRNKEGVPTGRIASRKPIRLPVNHLRDLVEQVVSRVCSLPLAINPFPANNSVLNKNGSIVVKQALEYIAYTNNEKRILRDTVRSSLIMGEGYVLPVWDKDRGPLTKEYAEAEKAKRKLKRLDRAGKPVKDASGNQEYIEGPVKAGDIRYITPSPIDIFLAPDNFYLNPVEWFMVREYVHVDKLKKQYPGLKDKIKATPDLQYFNYNTLDMTQTKNWVLKVHFYHDRTPELPEGKYICWTPDLLLYEDDLPYPRQDDQEFGGMPLVRLTGLDVMGELHATPNIIDIAALQHCYNQLTSVIRRNVIMGSTPHWTMPKGTVQHSALINQPTIFEYPPGLTPPKLEVFPTVTAETFNFRNEIKGEMEQLIGVYGVSRGDPPPNTRSAEQLSFYEEQQQQKAAGPTAKYAEFYLALKRKTLSTMADNYENDDERMKMIIGEDQMPIIQPFDVSVLGEPWNIHLMGVSALSQSPTMRRKELMDIRQMFGDELLTAEQYAELTQFGQVEKVYTLIGLALKSAEMENQLAAENQEIPEPQGYEEHIVHWKAHIKYLNAPGLKKWSEKQLQSLKDHVEAHEYLMWKLMMKNPGFGQQLLTLTGWPAFFVQPTEEAPVNPNQIVPTPPAGQPMDSAPQPITGAPPTLPGEPTAPPQQNPTMGQQMTQ